MCKPLLPVRVRSLPPIATQCSIVELLEKPECLMTLALFLHVIADVIWVGGMFVAYIAVRPAAAEVLEPPQRLRLWTGIFRRFFPWVWTAVILILASGFTMMGQMEKVPRYVIVMTAIGVIMSAIFMHIYFA